MKTLLTLLFLASGTGFLWAQPALSPDAAVMTPAETAAIKEAADRVKLDRPAHLVFVGDSLTAFYPDLNYVAVIRSELGRRFGDEVIVTNAGVRGDTITRVLSRLEKDVLTLTPAPTDVFVFVGHNDSKVSSSSGYTVSEVGLEDFKNQYRQVLGLIETRLKARVTVISAASSVFEITKETANVSAQNGKSHNLFGDPVWLEKFNAAAKGVAAEFGADYLDVYRPMKEVERKAGLFTKDGVHLNQHGNRFIAILLLDYLSRRPSQRN